MKKVVLSISYANGLVFKYSFVKEFITAFPLKKKNFVLNSVTNWGAASTKQSEKIYSWLGSREDTDLINFIENLKSTLSEEDLISKYFLEGFDDGLGIEIVELPSTLSYEILNYDGVEWISEIGKNFGKGIKLVKSL